MAPRLALLTLAPLALTACTQHDRAAPYDASRVPAVRIAGEPVDCIQLYNARDSRVRDDRTIDFMRTSREGWRVTLPHSCPGLAVQNAFTYKTSLSQLCSTDIIYVLETAGGLQRGAGCGLGRFVPIVIER